MKTLAFVLCSLGCFGATQQDETKGVSRMYVKEGEDAVLHCSSVESLENTVVDWMNQDKKEVCLYKRGQHCDDSQAYQDEQYKGRVSLFYDKLKNGNASLILNDTRIEDTGNYTCILPHLSSGSQSSTIELFVERVYKNRFGLKEGAVHVPYLKIVKESEAGVVLQCVVRGSSSKPSVEWQTCEGTSLNSEEPLVSETRGRYDTTLLVTVNETKTNCFRCVVKQEDIYHRIDDNIIVSEKLFEKKSCNVIQDRVAEDRVTPGSDAGLLVGVWFSGVVSLAFLLGLARALYLIIKSRKQRLNVKNVENGNQREMEHKTSDQNIGNGRTDTKNMRNGTVKTEKEKLMSSDSSASASST
ncbi:V-set domain-containing T-cell activation inhibitor 1-like [Solea solea]|uniref:V-set domain-containing T-cell activation inhibitor 1-like n=1 Tax=Solea solea TaxID=90069 RepID=UPI00272BBC98|nr:V-set domain-containing T-cell activation inhibitor 1-like [Solea solea]